MKSEYKINGTTIKRPSKFKIEKFKLSDLQRVASGKMVGDEIAKKRKFYFTYAAITTTDLNAILDLIWENTGMFFVLTYIEDNVTKTATVYAGAIPAELHMTDASEWVWKDVSFDLIEQ